MPVVRPIRLVVFGASAGGPDALATVIPALPADLPVPVLVVQHMPATFTADLATRIDATSALDVREAVDGETLAAGRVHVAPGGRHLKVVGGPEPRALLSDDPPENGCRPSVDVLLRSAVPVYGSGVLVVIMTGMGSDGLRGVRAVKEAGGVCLTQSPRSSSVYGMARSIDEEGLSDESVELAALATRVGDWVGRRRP